jgi:hypothetical protein
MFNPSKRVRRLAALPVLVAAALMLPLAAPGSAAPGNTFGAGVATGFVHSQNATSFMCQASGGYEFFGVAITGAVLDGTTPLVGTTGFQNQPTGGATSDPLNGTPLGCDGKLSAADPNGSVWTLLNDTVPPNGLVPLLSCPGAASTCTGGPNTSNILADEGTVAGGNGGRFNCAGADGVPPGLQITCDLSGTFVRYGGLVLVNLSGCVQVKAAGGADCSGAQDSEDVVLAAEVVPVPLQQDCATPFIVGSSCTALSGPYVITPSGTLDATQPAIDALYCPGALAGLAARTSQNPPICDGN